MATAIPFAVAGCKKDGNVIRINEVTHSVFYAPLYLADALGYFADEEIEIELTNGGGADNTMAAVLSGAADVGFCGPEAAIYVAIGGTTDQPKVFGQLTKRDGSFLVGRTAQPDFKWSDLEGKDVLAGRPGGVPFMTFEYVCKTQNVNANFVTNVNFNMMTAAFEGGTADYCTMFEPVASNYVAEGKGYIVASVGEESGEIPYTCFIAKDSYINKHGDKIEGFLRAVTKATKNLLASSSAETAKLIAPYFDGTSVDSLKTSLDSYKSIDAWVTNMAMTESSFTRLQDVIELAGELKKRVPFNDLVLTDTANKVYKEIYA
ncbi:MAG: ABC transporter substrate-binding protein [Clostridia bacterium]|nr:ABC transporter substrate-binding protein [Clostridia bacterium]